MCQYGDQVAIKVPETVTLRYNGPEKTKRETVSIDRCMVDVMKELWAKGVVTHSACCGHNGQFPAHIMADPEFAAIVVNHGYEQDKERLNLFHRKPQEKR